MSDSPRPRVLCRPSNKVEVIARNHTELHASLFKTSSPDMAAIDCSAPYRDADFQTEDDFTKYKCHIRSIDHVFSYMDMEIVVALGLENLKLEAQSLRQDYATFQQGIQESLICSWKIASHMQVLITDITQVRMPHSPDPDVSRKHQETLYQAYARGLTVQEGLAMAMSAHFGSLVDKFHAIVDRFHALRQNYRLTNILGYVARNPRYFMLAMVSLRRPNSRVMEKERSASMGLIALRDVWGLIQKRLKQGSNRTAAEMQIVLGITELRSRYTCPYEAGDWQPLVNILLRYQATMIEADETGTILRRTPEEPTDGLQWIHVCEVYESKPILLGIAVTLAVESEGKQALEQTMQALQEVVDEVNGEISSFRHTILRLLIRAATQWKVLPGSYYLEDVSRTSDGPVGFGGFADVYRASWRGQDVALKVIRMFTSTAERSDATYAPFLREIVLWRQLRHPSIQPFLGIDCKTFAPYIATVSKWGHRGSINVAIHSLSRPELLPLRPQWVSVLFITIKGLHYLYTRRIVHGDVRGANVLISKDLHVRLTDFGLASLVDAHTRTLGSCFGMAIRWAAPELLHDDTISRPTIACDIYAFACTCVGIFSGQSPFSHFPRDAQVVKLVLSGARLERPEAGERKSQTMFDALWDLVERCWQKEPVNRPDMHSVMTEMKAMVAPEVK